MVDVEQDRFFLKSVLEDTVPKSEVAIMIKHAFDSVIPRKAIDFKTNVAKVIQQCINMNGIPMFREKYASQPFPMGAVLMVCYGSHDGKMRGVWLKDTPQECLNIIAAKTDVYRQLLTKYGGNEMVRESYTRGGRVMNPPTLTSLLFQLKEAWLDEEKAISMYESIINDITVIRRSLDQVRHRTTIQTIDSIALDIKSIRNDETRHRGMIGRMIESLEYPSAECREHHDLTARHRSSR